MVSRLWMTGLKPGRGGAYEAFARSRSLPMFYRQEGFLGCVMGRNEGQCYVLTFWRDQVAITALEQSVDYQQTVAAILAADLLTEPQSTLIRPIHLCDLGQLSPQAS